MLTLFIRTPVLLIGGLLYTIVATAQVELHVQGITQDAGRPQLGCTKACCVEDGKPRPRIPVVSLGITQADPSKAVLIEATPDISSQWSYLTTQNKGVEPSMIFVTQASRVFFLFSHPILSPNVQYKSQGLFCLP